MNTGSYNTGHYNTGHYNTGDNNAGNRNTGHYNTGHNNTGHFNTGSYNTGSYNTCDNNAGNRNTGHSNTGHYNTGHSNTGHNNTGHFNTGHFNTGSYNTGTDNTGHFNTGDNNAGFFCVNDGPVLFFDCPVDISFEEAKKLIPNVNLEISCKFVSEEKMTEQEKNENRNWKAFRGFIRITNKKIQEVFPLAWAKMTEDQQKKWTSLPNFDPEKFLKCTGVDVRNKKQIVIEGVTYNLVKA